MNYLALGDSITFGHCAKTKAAPFPTHVQTLLAHAIPTRLQLLAKPGWTSDRLLQALSASKDRQCEETRLATLIIGGNDVIKHTMPLLVGRTGGLEQAAERLYANMERMIEMISHPKTTILVGTMYNPFPNWWVMETVTRIMNQRIRRLAELDNVYLLDLEKLFRSRENQWIDGYRQGRFLDLRPIGNPIHPSLKGHRIIAEEIVRVYSSIASSQVEYAQYKGQVVGV